MKKNIGIIIVIAIIGGIVFTILKSPKEDLTEETKAAQAMVEVVKVSELSQDTAPVVGYGQVVSSNSVVVVPETVGVVKRVYKTLGQTVRAGEVIIELQNSSQQQGVLQAQSGLSSSQASLQRTLRGANDDQLAAARAGVVAQQNASASTEASVLGGLDTLYTELDTLLVSDFGEFFSNPNTTFPSFTQDLDTDKEENILEQGLTDLNAELDQDRGYDDSEKALLTMERNIELFQSYTDELKVAVLEIPVSASLSQATLTRWGNDLVNTGNTLESKKVTLAGLRASLSSAEKALDSAEQTLAEVEDGADSEDVTIAQSGVSAARAGLGSAQIELQKTFITAPTFGRISSIETKIGQLVGSSAPVFVLTSNDAKRIDVFLTQREVARISVGSAVMIDGLYQGSVARIAPSIDVETGKVKVEIFPTETITLTEGAGVGVSLTTNGGSAGFALPIETVFVRSGQAYVYTVQSGKAVPTKIETEGLFGPVAMVTSGITGDDLVVSFARGVKDNQIISTEDVQVDVVEVPETATSSEVINN